MGGGHKAPGTLLGWQSGLHLAIWGQEVGGLEILHSQHTFPSGSECLK